MNLNVDLEKNWDSPLLIKGGGRRSEEFVTEKIIAFTWKVEYYFYKKWNLILIIPYVIFCSYSNMK